MEAKFTVLDLCVTRFYLFFREGQVTRKYRFDKQGRRKESAIP